MNITRRLMLGAATGLALAATSLGAVAQTPDDMLVIANRIDDITTLDPAQSFEFAGADVIRNVYGKLVNFDPADLGAGYQPDLAESWEVSEDGRTITFTMRPGMTFHSGNPVRAEDAAWSLQRAVKLDKTPSFILTQFGFTPENVEEMIRAEDDKVIITTDQKYAPSFVLNALTATIGAIVDKETVMQHEVEGDMGNEWLKTNSAGSYAYRVANWKPNESVTLEVYEDFYKGAPEMKRVIVRHIQESATQRLLLERGDIDAARNLNPEDIAGIQDAEGIEIDDILRGRLMYISLNQNHPQLSDPRVVEAIKHLIDYEGMQNSFLNGQYTIHQNFLPQTYLGAVDENPFEMNVERARELLDEAGIDELTLEVGVREAQERLEIAQSLQNTFAQAGINLEITVGTGQQILSRYRARDLPIYLGAWGPDYPDPHTNASTFAYNPDNSEDAQLTGILAWRNAWPAEGFTERVDAAATETDTATRERMYQEIQADFREEAPFVIMFQQIEQLARKDNVENLTLGEAITAAAYWPVTK
ncbi:putative D,D-dipeptide-binding periplasmic protein DdpA precursor [Jannaschia seosinensis]|uniref:Putative D,D-dipeptide-binding periplasmic protein DdpA n=1 Tax=Jannaschia seosinensis TaxID=313367 RepID=A0A0M7B6S1_9RHOB|nr:ABC transporter substrate-binding protein [Jannaschia seosinensis]CUH11979.1 putative D,D-dipeptide-binding periplasmic protein DdpA precursor [Jannaschia seosinensis]